MRVNHGGFDQNEFRFKLGAGKAETADDENEPPVADATREQSAPPERNAAPEKSATPVQSATPEKRTSSGFRPLAVGAAAANVEFARTENGGFEKEES